jgi:hypothetical protein
LRELELVDAASLELFPRHRHALVRLHLVLPPGGEIGLVDRVRVVEIAALGARVVALAEVFQRRIEFLQR